MSLADSPALRETLSSLFPGLQISAVAKPSGQRVVYFCRFSSEAHQKSQPDPDWLAWGPVVMKVSSGLDPMSVAYMQAEINVLKTLDCNHYPKLLLDDFITVDPYLEQKLDTSLFVTIETRVNAQPLSGQLENFVGNQIKITALLEKLVVALIPLWAHERKLVHRDLKPDNILIAQSGAVTIIDLGIVRETGAVGVTNTFAMFGPLSPPYASPEQAENKKKEITYKSDFFALGIIAYELMAGFNPFLENGASSTASILENITQLHPKRLDAICSCSPEFADVVEKLIQKQPYKRFRTPEQLRAALAALSKE